MPTESTKAAVQQLRDAGHDTIAEKLRDLVVTLEQHGHSISVGFIEWRPENGAAQILLRYVADLLPARPKETSPCPQPVTPAGDAARTAAPAISASAPPASSKKHDSAPREQKESDGTDE